MILCDREIDQELRSGLLIFEPPLERGTNGETKDQIQESSVDLRLAPLFRRFLTAKELAGMPGVSQELQVDPSDPGFDLRTLASKYSRLEIREEGEVYELGPGESVLGQTLEKVYLPNYLCGRVEGRSMLARLGVTVHNTAPTIQVGFKGVIALEISNHGPFTMRLRPKRLRICQLILERMSMPTAPYRGRFADQERI